MQIKTKVEYHLKTYCFDKNYSLMLKNVGKDVKQHIHCQWGCIFASIHTLNKTQL